jgi:DNA polymerase III subunit delta'
MLFSKIKGHSNNILNLSNQILNKNFEGVFLFSGPSAIGKYTIAKEIGRYLSCTGLEDDTCRCENCRLFPNVPDYFEINKKEKMITVEDIKPLSDFISLVAYRGRYRVAVINNADNMNLTVGNKLLKILEEIPPKCVIILVTNSPEKLLPTIVSRCYLVPFKSLNSEDLKEILKKLGYPSNSITEVDRMIPFFTHGVLGNFSRYLECANLSKDLLKDISKKSEDDIISLIRDINEKGDLEIFLEIFLIFINDLMKIRYESPDVICNVRHVDYLEECLNIWSADLCIFMIDALRKINNNLKRKINLKVEQLFLPSMMWAYYFINKGKKKK